MGRFTRTRRQIRNKPEIPPCIFSRGKKAGVRCVTLQTLTIGGRTVKFCGDPMCCYYEPIPESSEAPMVRIS